MRKLWDNLKLNAPPIIISAIVSIIIGVISYVSITKYLSIEVHREWFIEKALKAINKNMIGDYKAGSIMLTNKSKPHILTFYTSPNQTTNLYLSATHSGEEENIDFELTLNGRKIKKDNLVYQDTFGSTKIPIESEIKKAREQSVHKYNENTLNLSIQVVPSQDTKNNVVVEYFLYTVGLAELPDRGNNHE